MPARERIREVVEKWFLIEPLLFAVWTTHELVAEPRIRTIRVHQGRVEYNPAFIAGLDRRDVEQVLALEAMRILLKHPYARRPENAELAYAASNLTLQEYLETTLPLPRARDIFGCPDFDRQYYEFYYHKLAEPWPAGQTTRGQAESSGGAAATLDGYTNPRVAGWENTDAWGPDELRVEQINERIRAAAETDSWGSLPGRCKERILAALRP
jgi:hypothetical protein